jgi:hypothetical protein
VDPFLELLVVLGAIYLYDCLQWVRREGTVFRSFRGTRFHAVPGTRFAGHERAGFTFGQPLPPFGRLHVTQPCPVSLSVECAYSHVAAAHNPGGKIPTDPRLVAWTEMKDVRAEGREVLVGGKRFVTSSSPRGAEHVASLLVRLRDTPRERRQAAIEREIASWFDVERVRTLDAGLRAVLAPPTWCATVLFVVLYVALPVLGYTVGLAVSWLWIGIAVLAAHITTLVVYTRARRRLRPGRTAELVGELVPLVLAPPAAIRVGDVLTRDAFADLHPLAVARALVPDAEFAEMLERAGRDAVHPLLPPCPSDDARAIACEAEHRARMVHAMERFAREVGADPTAWRGPPRVVEPDCTLYCPRCSRQYLPIAMTCEPCFGRSLEPLPTRP